MKKCPCLTQGLACVVFMIFGGYLAHPFHPAMESIDCKTEATSLKLF